MRLVVDHHVDRLEMQGCISKDPESTSTNSPEACQLISANLHNTRLAILAPIQLSKRLDARVFTLAFDVPVTLSEGPHPFPSRTRKLSPLEPMVLRG